MASKERPFIFDYLREIAWGLKTPVIGGGLAAGSYWAVKDIIPNMPGAQEKMAAAQATRDAYQTELERAYQFTYPNDTNVTRTELGEFEEVALTLDDSFRYSNFEYQNNVYTKLVELYGSPQGELKELYDAQYFSGPELMQQFVLTFGLGAAVIALFATLYLPVAAHDRARWKRW